MLRLILYVRYYEGHPIHNENFSTEQLIHTQDMKSLTKLARLFGCSHVPFSTGYIAPDFVAGQH